MKERYYVPEQTRVCSGIRTALCLLICMALQVITPARAQTKSGPDKLTIDADNRSIAWVLQQVQQNTHFRFVYSNGLLNDKQLVTVHLKDGSLQQLMDVLLKNTNLVFEEQQNGF